jgi:hypothetical protein
VREGGGSERRQHSCRSDSTKGPDPHMGPEKQLPNYTFRRLSDYWLGKYGWLQWCDFQSPKHPDQWCLDCGAAEPPGSLWNADSWASPPRFEHIRFGVRLGNLNLEHDSPLWVQLTQVAHELNLYKPGS